ncbi:glycosyltransferase family 2 protein [Vibrio sp. 1640]|uniref:glycosyltransferase family 2 protein n=1 Tax=Vibrio sp. 1640 TaxID=3074570 RepID=UPI002964F930|nr:glycosyltransferase family 2 protein [Vibrio sp. 1640]MDW2080742.1 glycosyltransferase family 2 protein [Vibrio sp. 1640]
MKISIVTVCFNNLEGLKRTLDSIPNKTYLPNIEVIIKDGGSTDGTLQFLDKFNAKYSLKVIKGEDNGIYDAMNIALSRARGDHVIFMNSGDCFSEGVLESIIEHRLSSESLYYGDAKFYYENGSFAFDLYANMSSQKCFLKHNCFSHQAIFYPTALLKELSGYCLKYKVSSDFDLTWRCRLSECKFEYLNKVIAKCELGGVSCQQGLRSYRDRIESFFSTGSYSFMFILISNYPFFFFKNRLVKFLDGSSLLNAYRHYKAR